MKDLTLVQAQMYIWVVLTQSDLDAKVPPIILSTSFLHNLNYEDALLEVQSTFVWGM